MGNIPMKPKEQLYTDSTTAEYYLSDGLQNLGIDVLFEYAQYIKTTYAPDHIISIGSGSGVCEKLIDDHLGTNIICVDPDSDDYITAPQKFKKEPTYANASELLKVNHKIENCAMFLNWSNPNGSSFDYDAVQLLKPKYILWIGDPSGCAGGAKFLEFYGDCSAGNGEYQIIKETVKNGKDNIMGWDMFYTIAILSKKI